MLSLCGICIYTVMTSVLDREGLEVSALKELVAIDMSYSNDETKSAIRLRNFNNPNNPDNPPDIITLNFLTIRLFSDNHFITLYHTLSTPLIGNQVLGKTLITF